MPSASCGISLSEEKHYKHSVEDENMSTKKEQFGKR